MMEEKKQRESPAWCSGDLWYSNFSFNLNIEMND